jgi:hypothetical protein
MYALSLSLALSLNNNIGFIGGEWIACRLMFCRSIILATVFILVHRQKRNATTMYEQSFDTWSTIWELLPSESSCMIVVYYHIQKASLSKSPSLFGVQIHL